MRTHHKKGDLIIIIFVLIVLGVLIKFYTGLAVISPENNKEYNSQNIDINISSNDFYYKYSINEGENITFTPNITLTGLEEGKHNLVIYSIGEEWNKSFEGGAYDSANSIIQTSDEGYAIFGNTNSFGAGLYDFWVVKINKSGVEEWNKTYGGTNYEVANSIIQTSDEGYILVGFTDSFGESWSDFWVIKLDSNGEQEWNKTYGGKGFDIAKSVIETSEDGKIKYVIAGYSDSFGGGMNSFVVKINESGFEEWNKSFDYDAWDLTNSIIQSPDEGYILAGVTGPQQNDFDFWVVKINSSGNVVWNKTYEKENNDIINSITYAFDEGYVLTGSTYSFETETPDFWVVKINETGEEEWNKTFWGLNDDSANSITQTSNGYILAGQTKSFGNENKDAWIIKINKTGEEEWNKTFGGLNDDSANSIIKTSEGYVLAGESYSSVSDFNFWVIKIKESVEFIEFYIKDAEEPKELIKDKIISPENNKEYDSQNVDINILSNDFYYEYSINGKDNITFIPNITLTGLEEGKHNLGIYSIEKEWNKTYGGENNDVANSITQASDEGYILAGYTTKSDDDRDFWVVKINSSGDEEWNKTYGGGGYDYVSSIIQGHDGYIIIGNTYSFGEGYSDFWVLKINSSGDEEWNKTYGKSGYDVSSSIIKTSDEGYIIAGYSDSFGGGMNSFVIKINETGGEEWNKTYGEINWDQTNSIIEIDDGYVLVGYTESYGEGDKDFWVLKINETGGEEWNKTFGGLNDDSANSIIEIDDGYVLVGYTESYGEGDKDFWVLKINETGEEEWNKTFGGLNDDSANSIIEIDNGYVLVGDTNSFGVGKDSWVLRINKDGGEIWNKSFGGENEDSLNSIIKTSEGYVFGGHSYSYSRSSDFWVVKLKNNVEFIDFSVKESEEYKGKIKELGNNKGGGGNFGGNSNYENTSNVNNETLENQDTQNEVLNNETKIQGEINPTLKNESKLGSKIIFGVIIFVLVLGVVITTGFIILNIKGLRLNLDNFHFLRHKDKNLN
jgi:hypothetical protein